MSTLVDTCSCGAPLSMLPADHVCARSDISAWDRIFADERLRRARRHLSAHEITLIIRHVLASADTHPKDGDAVAAPLVSGAVGAEGDETPKVQP